MDQRDIEMTDSDALDEVNSSTDLNKAINSPDKDFLNDDYYSQDLFDDTVNSEDNSPCINFHCSQTARVNSPRIADLTSLTQTPKIGREESSPCRSTIPTIPRSLLPFISTVNESWNSDLETPQAKTAAEMNLQRSERREQLLKSCETMEMRGVIPDVATPSGCFLAQVENEEISASPILNTMIKRRRPKRRILKSLIEAKEITNVCHTSAGGIEHLESLTRNDAISVANATFVIDEDCSLHNSNIRFIEDRIDDQDPNLVQNEEEECPMNKRLESCGDLGGIDEVVLDPADAESSTNKTGEKSFAKLVEEIEELEENKGPVAEHKYADIPMDVFTKDAKALENANITPMRAQNISNVKRQWGLISFTEMCELEQANNETENPDSTIESLEFPHNPLADKLITDKSALASKDNEDIVGTFSTSVFEKDELIIDDDEFSPWFYQPNEAKSEFSNDTNSARNLIEKNSGGVKTGEMTVENNKLINCATNSTTNKAKIINNGELCIKETTEDGENSYKKIFKGTASSKRQMNDEEKMYTDLCTIGFSTASGKPIAISEEKIRRAAKLYDEIALQDGTHRDAKSLCKKKEDLRTNNEENKEVTLGNSCSTMGFSTASGKAIKISEDKLKRAEKLYEEIALQDKTHCNAIMLREVPRDQKIKNKENEATIVANSYCSVGFSTASGKAIKISEEKLKEAEKLYNEMNLADNLKLPVNPLKVPISRGVKRKYEHDDGKIDVSLIRGTESSVGFKTACGKPLIIGETAIKKAKMIYQSLDIPESQSLKYEESTKESATSVNDEDSCKLKRLSTAAHLNMNANTEIKQELGNSSEVTSRDNLINKPRETDNAGNQRMKIAIQQDQSSAKNHSIHRTVNTGISIPTASISSGFSTAGGIAIKISNEALSNARNFLVEDENHLQSNPSMKIVETDACAKLFINNNKTMKTSEDPLLKARRLLFTEQENTPPANTVTKRNNSAMETPENENASVSYTPALKSLSENILSDKTPLGLSISHTSKRVRFHSDLQARKLFGETGGDSDEERDHSDQFYKGYKKGPQTPLNISNYARHSLNREKNNAPFGRNSTTGFYTNSEMFDMKDRLMVPQLEAQTSWPLNQASDSMRLKQGRKDQRISIYSDEITASTEALLADEENSLDGRCWASAITCSPTLTEDKDISTKPITSDAELPPSPILGAKHRSRRKNKRRRKNTGNKDMGSRDDLREEQVASQGSQPSSGIATPSSDSSKESHRITSTVIETALISELEKLGETSSRVEFFDNQSQNSGGGAIGEIDDREVIPYLSENHTAARMKQEMEIRAKKKCKPKPIPGNLLLRKSENRESRVSWRRATNGVPPKPRTACELMNLGIAPDVMEVTAASALNYRFKCVDFYSKSEILANAYGLDTGDGGRLIFDENGYAGVAEFEQAFSASPGVDPTLVPLRWVENHYRWIVWKLASMDRMKFGDLLMSRMLTPHHVMEQLKYRYDREIDKSQRPALRRIIEKDDPPNRRMVLCVATITKFEDIQASEKSPKMSPTTHWKVELTDGWYSIRATIDLAMSHMIAVGKVREGTKLVTCRAELLNCEQGCFPLEIPGDASLKIHTNSTRRVKWDTKLGYCGYSGPIPASLPAILPNGGLIGKLSAIIARVYPMQFFEKTCNGQSVFRNSKCEDKAVMIYEKERQAQIDAVYAEARAEFEARNRNRSKRRSDTISNKSSEYSSQSQKTSDKSCRDKWTDVDHDSYEQSYGNELEEAFRIEVEAKLRESLPPPRKVTSILKVRVMDGNNLAIITVWSPGEDIIDVIKEGNRVSIHNVQTSDRRSGELQLSVGRQSFVKPEEANVPSFPRRCLTSLPEISVAGFNPPFGEFDTVGIVISLGPAPYGMKNFEVVNLAYPNPDQSDSAYLSILFWEGIGAHGFSEILSIGAIVACTNLQWRRGAPRTIPVAYSTEHSTFTRNPRQIYLRSAFDLVKSQITDPVTYVSQCAEEIATEHQKKSANLRSPAVQGTPNKGSPSAAIIQDKFVPGMSPRTPQSLVNTKEITPAKYSIQRRLEKLQWYGDPPDLSPVLLNHSSTKVNQKFVPPARTPDGLDCSNKRRDSYLKK